MSKGQNVNLCRFYWDLFHSVIWMPTLYPEFSLNDYMKLKYDMLPNISYYVKKSFSHMQESYTQ